VLGDKEADVQASRSFRNMGTELELLQCRNLSRPGKQQNSRKLIKS